MNNDIYIYRASSFYHPVDARLPALKTLVRDACGHSIRRIDRLTQLALIGAFRCKGELRLEANTGLYLCSPLGSLSNSLELFQHRYQQNQPPPPLKFINTVGNVACFHVSQQLALQASNQFLARSHFALEAGLRLARIDLLKPRVQAALVGVVTEFGQPVDTYRQRFGIAENQALNEESHWLLLARNIPGEQAIGKVIDIQEPLCYSEMLARIEQQAGEGSEVLQFAFGDKVKPTERRDLIAHAASTPATEPEACQPALRYATAAQLCRFVMQHQSGPRRLLCVDTDGAGRWSLVCVESL